MCWVNTKDGHFKLAKFVVESGHLATLPLTVPYDGPKVQDTTANHKCDSKTKNESAAANERTQQQNNNKKKITKHTNVVTSARKGRNMPLTRICADWMNTLSVFFT